MDMILLVLLLLVVYFLAGLLTLIVIDIFDAPDALVYKRHPSLSRWERVEKGTEVAVLLATTWPISIPMLVIWAGVEACRTSLRGLKVLYAEKDS